MLLPEAEARMTRVFWVSKCWSSKFRIKLIVHFCDILPKAFCTNFFCVEIKPVFSIVSIVGCAPKIIRNFFLSFFFIVFFPLPCIPVIRNNILQKSGEHLWPGELEVTLWAKGGEKGKQQLNGKRLRSKTEFLHYQQLTLKLIFSPYIFSDFSSFFSLPLG